MLRWLRSLVEGGGEEEGTGPRVRVRATLHYCRFDPQCAQLLQEWSAARDRLVAYWAEGTVVLDSVDEVREMAEANCSRAPPQGVVRLPAVVLRDDLGGCRVVQEPGWRLAAVEELVGEVAKARATPVASVILEDQPI